MPAPGLPWPMRPCPSQHASIDASHASAAISLDLAVGVAVDLPVTASAVDATLDDDATQAFQRAEGHSLIY